MRNSTFILEFRKRPVDVRTRKRYWELTFERLPEIPKLFPYEYSALSGRAGSVGADGVPAVIRAGYKIWNTDPYPLSA